MNIQNDYSSEKLYNLLMDLLNIEEIENFNAVNSCYENKEIIIYGAGNLGLEALDILGDLKIRPKFIIDKSENKWGKNINGINIIDPEIVSSIDKENCIIAVCVVNFPYSNIEKYLMENEFKNIIPFWDLLKYLDKKTTYNNGWRVGILDNEVKNNIISIYNGFSDDISRALYIQALYWRVKREEILFKDISISLEDKFFPKNIMPDFINDEVFIDCGGYTGNTIEKFINSVNCNFEKIIAFEPDCENYKGLEKYVFNLRSNVKEKIEIYNYALDENANERLFLDGMAMNCKFSSDSSGIIVKSVNLDNFLINEKITILKIHTEGSEFDIIKGSINIIKKQRPIIMITIYHNQETAIELPIYLMNNLEKYKFYHRLHAYCGIESVLYLIPDERDNKLLGGK